MDSTKCSGSVAHGLTLEGRSKMSISGVTDVDCFDESTVLVYTVMGELTVKGKHLQVDSLSVETGDVSLQGDVWSIRYGDRDRLRVPTWLSKLLR